MKSTICVCGISNCKNWRVVDAIPIVECRVCGVRRVGVLDEAKYLSRYESGDYHAEDRSYDTGHKAHTERFDHDALVAAKRLQKLERFEHTRNGKLLDVGCANGAFMVSAGILGYDVYGCDLSTDALVGADEAMRRTQKGALEDCNFTRRTFDVVAFNDVLEHIPDPIPALQTARGLLKRSGILVVEVPDMGQAESEHHVKPKEHLWYFTANQLRQFLEAQGFFIAWMDQPIPGKVTAYAMPTCDVEQVNVYGPPGIGDIAWTMIKLQGIREREAPCKLNYIVCAADVTDKLSTRAKDFMLLSRDIDTIEFRPIPLPREDRGNIHPSKAEYELLANDYLEPEGKDLQDWHPELPTDWDLRLDLDALPYAQAKARIQTDNYVAIYLSSQAWNRAVALPDWTNRDWAELCVRLDDAGAKPVIIGASWDATDKDVAAEIAELGRVPSKVWVNLTGKTTIPLAIAVMMKAQCTIGPANGLPMIPAYYGLPTVILWPQKGVSNGATEWCVAFQKSWIPPHYREMNTALPFGEATPENVCKAALKWN